MAGGLFQFFCFRPILFAGPMFHCGGVAIVPRATLSLQDEGLLVATFPSQFVVLTTVHARAKCPNLRHFRHLFERLEYRNL
jgi:hypothetical protein